MLITQQESVLSMRQEGNRLPMAQEGSRRSTVIKGTFLWLLTLCIAFFTPGIVASPLAGHVPLATTCTFMDLTKGSGEKWHPHLQPFGVARCILCTCQNGSVDCRKEKCPKLECARKIHRPLTCCEECDANPSIKEQDINRGCTERFTLIQRTNGARWRPASTRHERTGCVVCICKDRTITCRMRCPRVCHKDLTKNPCCQYCPDDVKAKAGREDAAKLKRKEEGKLADTKNQKFEMNFRDFLAFSRDSKIGL